MYVHYQLLLLSLGIQGSKASVSTHPYSVILAPVYYVGWRLYDLVASYVLISGGEGIVMWKGIIFLIIIVNNSFEQSRMKLIRYGSMNDLYYMSDCMTEYKGIHRAILAVMSKLFLIINLQSYQFHCWAFRYPVMNAFINGIELTLACVQLGFALSRKTLVKGRRKKDRICTLNTYISVHLWTYLKRVW